MEKSDFSSPKLLYNSEYQKGKKEDWDILREDLNIKKAELEYL